MYAIRSYYDNNEHDCQNKSSNLRIKIKLCKETAEIISHSSRMIEKIKKVIAGIQEQLVLFLVIQVVWIIISKENKSYNFV